MDHVTMEFPVSTLKPDPLIGSQLGNYHIVKLLGEGGMGAVYLGQHTQLPGKRVAIKMLHPDISREQSLVTRFYNEARAASVIGDPGIIKVDDFGRHPNGSSYILMEFLEGESLSDLLQRQPKQDPLYIVFLARQLARSLGAAHDKGIVHRDLKPQNIFLVPDPDIEFGRAKVLDFGIAKLSGDELDAGDVKTASRAILGTPAYMSPEQCEASVRVDARSDIYSLGCILYEMATGQRAFIEKSQPQLLVAQMTKNPPPVRSVDPAIPEFLEWVIHKCLAKDPKERFQTMGELRAALETLPRTTGAQPAAAWPALTPQQLPISRPPADPAAGLTAPEIPRARGGHAQPAAVPVTTLGGAAAQSVARPSGGPRRKWIAAGVAIAAAAVTIVVIAVAKSGGGSPPVNPPPAAGAEPASSMAPTVGTPSAAAVVPGPATGATFDAGVVTPASTPVPSAAASAAPDAGGAAAELSASVTAPAKQRHDERKLRSRKAKPDAGPPPSDPSFDDDRLKGKVRP